MHKPTPNNQSSSFATTHQPAAGRCLTDRLGVHKKRAFKRCWWCIYNQDSVCSTTVLSEKHNCLLHIQKPAVDAAQVWRMGNLCRESKCPVTVLHAPRKIKGSSLNFSSLCVTAIWIKKKLNFKEEPNIMASVHWFLLHTYINACPS